MTGTGDRARRRTGATSGDPSRTSGAGRPRDPEPSDGGGASGLAGLAPLVAIALVLVVLLALREIASLLVPVLFGLFLALVASPLVVGLERRGAGRTVALGGAIGVVLLVVLVATGIIAISIAELVVLVPRYEDRLAGVVVQVRELFASLGIAADPEALPGIVSPGTLASIAQSTTATVSRAAAAIFVLAVTLVFALAGARSLEERARRAFGDRHRSAELVERFGIDLRRYLVVRTQLGLFAAVLVFVLLVVLGIPLPALWAFLIFAAAFIPSVGTIVALVPPTLLALLDSGPLVAGAVVVGTLLVNVAQDYVLQPRMMGTELNLSSLVVFLSIVVWAWVLGPAGALLAVPLTVGLVALLEATPTTRPLAALMRNEIEGPTEDEVAGSPAV